MGPLPPSGLDGPSNEQTSVDGLVAALEAIAPARAAAPWDNVGLLLRGDRPVRRIGVCIDLTEPVWQELSSADVDAVVAYHPPIFQGLKRLTGATPRERTLLAALRSRVHVYAPHTALDSAVDGMGDWLAQAVAPRGALLNCRPVEPVDWNPAVGVGRRAELITPIALGACIDRIKSWLGLRHLRVAGDLSAPRQSLAVCPGSGGSVLRGLSDVDLLLTGEMGHHEVLAHVAAGGAVVLTDHTHCERGYLPLYAERIRIGLPGVEVVVSQVDDDPLRVI